MRAGAKTRRVKIDLGVGFGDPRDARDLVGVLQHPGKVAKVVLDKPEIEFLVEGHTDNKSIQNEVLLDNWDLSVKRATSVVRVLQNDFGVQPERMTAAGRSYYVPVADNDTAENRAKNRRTRIVVLPKLDQFYDLIEQGMQAAGGN